METIPQTHLWSNIPGMFSFEDENQLEIRASVRKLAKKDIPRFQSEEFYSTVPKELFEIFAAFGLTGITVDEKYGGSGAGPTTAMIVLEEIAAVDAGAAVFLAVHLMVAGLVQRFGNDEQRKNYLPDLVAGKKLAAFALTEPSAGSDAASLKMRAELDGDNYLLTGEKCYITSAGFADIYLVFARTANGISAFLVDKESNGLEVGPPEKKMGAELSPIASLSFNQTEVPVTQLIGTVDDGFKIALGALAGGRINIAACANGISRTAIDLSVAHLNERKQFDKQLIEFQGLRFMLADMQIKLEAAQLLTWQAARSLEDDITARENRIQTSMAKCFSTDSAMEITTDAVQLLGGAGYVKEYRVEQLMRDAKMMQIVEGTNQIQRLVIAKELIQQSL